MTIKNWVLEKTSEFEKKNPEFWKTSGFLKKPEIWKKKSEFKKKMSFEKIWVF